MLQRGGNDGENEGMVNRNACVHIYSVTHVDGCRGVRTNRLIVFAFWKRGNTHIRKKIVKNDDLEHPRIKEKCTSIWYRHTICQT